MLKLGHCLHPSPSSRIMERWDDARAKGRERWDDERWDDAEPWPDWDEVKHLVPDWDEVKQKYVLACEATEPEAVAASAGAEAVAVRLPVQAEATGQTSLIVMEELATQYLRPLSFEWYRFLYSWRPYVEDGEVNLDVLASQRYRVEYTRRLEYLQMLFDQWREAKARSVVIRGLWLWLVMKLRNALPQLLELG